MIGNGLQASGNAVIKFGFLLDKPQIGLFRIDVPVLGSLCFFPLNLRLDAGLAIHERMIPCRAPGHLLKLGWRHPRDGCGCLLRRNKDIPKGIEHLIALQPLTLADGVQEGQEFRQHGENLHADGLGKLGTLNPQEP